MSGGVEGVALLPCPFCGSPEVYPQDGDAWRRDTGTRFQFIWCIRCNTKGAEHPTEAEAIAAWNTRTAPPARTYAEGDWVLVPREITQAMLDATCATDADDAAMRNTWAELLHSAPTPPLATSRSQHEGAGR